MPAGLAYLWQAFGISSFQLAQPAATEDGRVCQGAAFTPAHVRAARGLRICPGFRWRTSSVTDGAPNYRYMTTMMPRGCARDREKISGEKISIKPKIKFVGETHFFTYRPKFSSVLNSVCSNLQLCIWVIKKRSKTLPSASSSHYLQIIYIFFD